MDKQAITINWLTNFKEIKYRLKFLIPTVKGGLMGIKLLRMFFFVLIGKFCREFTSGFKLG